MRLDAPKGFIDRLSMDTGIPGSKIIFRTTKVLQY
jgi:hypothetical protein